MEYVSKHITALTALVTLGSGIGSLSFLVSYLSQFSWSLIWLIEYTDIIKVGIVLFAFMAGYVTFFVTWVQFCQWFSSKKYSQWINVLVYGLPSIIVLGGTLLLNFVFKVDYPVYYGSMIGLGVTIAGTISELINKHEGRPTIISLITPQMAIQIFFILDIAASAMAQYTRYNEGTLSYVVTEGDTYYNTRIVMLLSHHTVLLVDNDIRVIKTDLIKDIVMYKWNYKASLDRH